MTTDTLWYTRCPVPTASGIAIRSGWIERAIGAQGIAVRSLADSNDRDTRQSHFEHTVPNSFRHGGNGPPIVARSRGTDVRVIGISWNNGWKPILTLPGSGISKVADLAGKRLSLPVRRKDSIDFWRATVLRGYERALATAGLTLDDVKLVEVPTDRAFIDDTAKSAEPGATLWDARFMLGHQREEAFALVRGEVDVIYSQGAIAALVDGFLGSSVVTDVGALLDVAHRVNNDAPLILTTGGSLIDENVDLVAHWLAEVLRAAAWAKSNQREAKRFLAADVGVAEELIDRAYTRDIHLELAVNLSPDRVVALKSQHDHLLAHGFLAAPVDFSKFVDSRPLIRARELLRALAKNVTHAGEAVL